MLSLPPLENHAEVFYEHGVLWEWELALIFVNGH